MASLDQEGLLILIGGVLLITPGVITDGIGLLFIFPLSRKLLAPRILRKMALRGGMGTGGVYFGGMGPMPGHPPSGFAPPPVSPTEEEEQSAQGKFKHPIQ